MLPAGVRACLTDVSLSVHQPAGSRLLGITDPATLSVEYDYVPIATYPAKFAGGLFLSFACHQSARNFQVADTCARSRLVKKLIHNLSKPDNLERIILRFPHLVIREYITVYQIVHPLLHSLTGAGGQII